MKNKEINIRNNTLEIWKTRTDYIISDKKADIIIHAEKINLNPKSPTWLYLATENDAHVGIIWIDKQIDNNKIQKLMEE